MDFNVTPIRSVAAQRGVESAARVDHEHVTGVEEVTDMVELGMRDVDFSLMAQGCFDLMI